MSDVRVHRLAGDDSELRERLADFDAAQRQRAAIAARLNAACDHELARCLAHVSGGNRAQRRRMRKQTEALRARFEHLRRQLLDELDRRFAEIVGAATPAGFAEIQHDAERRLAALFAAGADPGGAPPGGP